MIEPWGQSPSAGTWPHPTPVWTLAALLLALASGALVAVYRYHAVWTPLQRAYAPTYLRCVVMAAVGVTTTGRYRLLEVETAAGFRLALDEEVEHAAGTDAGFRLTDVARAVGDRHVAWRDASYPHAALAAFLARWIYRDQTLAVLLRPAWWSGLAVLALGLLVALPVDAARTRERRHGHRLNGPELPRHAAALLERPAVPPPRPVRAGVSGDGPATPGASTTGSGTAGTSQRHAVDQVIDRLAE